MLAKAADWTGVIVIGSLEINAQVFSAATRKVKISLVNVHTRCSSPLTEPEAGEAVAKEEELKPRVTPVARELFCAACQKPVPADEQGKAYKMEDGELVLLSDSELLLLKPEPTKRVLTRYISSDDPYLETLGFGRRLYLFPKPTSTKEYYQAWEVLKQAKRFAFSDEIVIKGESYPIAIKPIMLPAEMADGKERKVLIMDAVRDPSEFKRTTELTVLPDREPQFEAGELAEAITGARSFAMPLDLESLRNPRQRKLARLIEGKKKKKRK